MVGQKSKSVVSKSSTGATSSKVMQPRQRMAQNFLLIWVDPNIDQSKQDCQNTLAQLRSVVNDVHVFVQQDEAIDFLTEIDNMEAFLLVNDNIGQLIVPLIHDIPQLDSIYIFCRNKSDHEPWTDDWVKIQGVHTQINPICEKLKLAVKQCNQDTIAMSFMAMGEEGSNQNLNQLEPSYMYTQIFKEILLEMKHEEKSIQHLAIYCRTIYKDNPKELSIIEEFEKNYRKQSPIWWYTRECFTYQMLNRSLRHLEGGTIINMGFFIHDLHKQIQQLHREQVSSYGGKPFTVYRGQRLLNTDFAKLWKSKGRLMSFNNFLSTSTDRELALFLAESASTGTDIVGILFTMTIDPSVSSAPFASIREFSHFPTEEEILFSMHTVFRVNEITKLEKNSSLYQVDLSLTADDDEDLRLLTEHIREEVVGGTGWQRLGNLLLKLNQLDKATELYTVLLEQGEDEGEKALYYNQLGTIKNDQGDSKQAVEYFEKSLGIKEKTLPRNHPSLATSYNNIGMVYKNMGEYSKALSFYEKSLEIQEKTLPANHPDLATSYNNIAAVYDDMGEYSKALSFFEKSLGIYEKTLPANHPLLATSYNNIAGVYDNMGEYSKALSFLEKSLGIEEKTLPANHPNLAASYNNIGSVYQYMGEYWKALSFYEKSLGIKEKTLPANHPDLATSYNNIAGVYDDMGDYSKALSFYEKSLGIEEKTLPANHPSLATSYNNIGMAYKNMGEYSKALSFLEKSLGIREKTLPTNHPDLATSYNSIGTVYDDMEEYSKALSFYEKSLGIFEKSLPANHPSLATSYINIGGVYNNMGEYSEALSFYEKSLGIEEKTLPANHPSLATSYNNIGMAYKNMEEYSKALSFFQRALNIFQNSLPSSHPNIKLVQENIKILKKQM